MDRESLDQESVIVWPALREERLDDWILRFGGGLYGRSNSVQPYGDPGCPIDEAIDRIEGIYRQEGLVPTFRLPALPEFAELDDRLAEREYVVEDATKVMVASIPPLADLAIGVEGNESVTEEWLGAYCSLNHRAPGRETTVRQIWSRVGTPRRFSILRRDGETVSIGMGVVHDGRVWVFGMATHPDFRGQGMATAIITDLLSWGWNGGAERTALQVVADNGPALALYSKFGYTEAYRYHYRRRR